MRLLVAFLVARLCSFMYEGALHASLTLFLLPSASGTLPTW